MSWRPIETAPQDGSYVLVFGSTKDGLRATAARYDPDWSCGGQWIVTRHDRTHFRVRDATHWMPLPANPERR